MLYFLALIIIILMVLIAEQHRIYASTQFLLNKTNEINSN